MYPGKSLFDVTFSVLGVLMFSPAWIISAVLMVVLYKYQTSSSRLRKAGGDPFMILKTCWYTSDTVLWAMEFQWKFLANSSCEQNQAYFGGPKNHLYNLCGFSVQTNAYMRKHTAITRCLLI